MPSKQLIARIIVLAFVLFCAVVFGMSLLAAWVFSALH